MSANLDLVRSIYADWERGDFGSVEWAHPEIEYVIADGLQPGTWKGRTEMAEGFRDFLGGLEEYRLEAEEYRELDADRVVAITRNTGHGKVSGVNLGDLQGSGAAVFHVRDGRVAKLTFYWDRDRALADLGLKEQAMRGEPATPDTAELARRAFEAVNRGDLDEIMSFFAPDCVWDDSGIGLGTREGLTAIREHIEAWIGSYEEFEWMPEEQLDLGNGVRFGVSIQKGRPVGSIGHVHQRFATVTVWVEGLIERFTTYPDISEARAAAERLAESRE